MKYLRLFLLALCTCAVLSGNSDAQFIQQGDKLVGAGAAGNAQQGTNVSLSSDGNTAIVGGYRDQPRFSFIDGAAWIFTRSSGVWSQQGSKLFGTGAAGSSYQGYSVSLSLDGNTALVSGHEDSNMVGAAWVFVRAGGVWNQQGPKLVGTGAAGGSTQGFCVALSGDGNTAIVGGPFDNNNAGASWIFTRTDTVWSQQGNKLIGAGAVGSAFQGGSVALSSDGNTAIMSGFLDNNSKGAVWIFTRSGGVWSQQGSKLVGTGAVGSGARQGSSVALSADGNTALVGAIADSNYRGALWVFTRTAGVWQQQGEKLVGTGDVPGTTYGSEQGYCVSLSGDGNTALEGAYADSNNAGAAWIFRRNGTTWTQAGGKLVGAGAVGYAWQGYGLALSSDGHTFIMGGNMDDGLKGAAWVFVDASPLPIQISVFKALVAQSRCVQIEWATVSETHNYGFIVERRGQGEGAFTDVPGSFEPGHGTTTYPQKYAFMDTSAAAGTWLYRLKQIDLDGTDHYTESVSVDLPSGPAPLREPEKFSVDQNFPNPFNPTTSISYQIPTRSRVTIRVADILGREVATVVDGIEEPGNKSVQFEGGRLASGVYFYRVQAVPVGGSPPGAYVQIRKMILTR